MRRVIAFVDHTPRARTRGCACIVERRLTEHSRARAAETMEHPPSTDADPAAWRMVRLYDDGVESHWGEAEFALKAGGAIGKLSEKIPCDGAYLRYTKGSYDFPWHNAPRRQIVVCLNSRTEVTTGRGVTKTFGAGDLVLAEDLRGQGHCSRCVDGEGRWSLFLSLPDDDAADAPPSRVPAAVETRVALAFAAGVAVGALAAAAALRRRHAR